MICEMIDRTVDSLCSSTAGEKSTWELPGGRSIDFSGLIDALHQHWLSISDKLPSVEDVKVIGIDLTKRTRKPAGSKGVSASSCEN